MPWKCAFVEPTNQVRRRLRRYRSASDGSESCSGPYGYHNAWVDLDVVEIPRGALLAMNDDEVPAEDPRWPTHCACGYAFVEDDRRQVFPERLYVDRATGLTLPLREAPVGWMWDADWMHRPGPDGRSLVLKTPGDGEWWIDGPASNGPGWHRSGEPPRITARPSIVIPGPQSEGGRYHGWLTDGVLSDDLDGKIFDEAGRRVT